ncbi:MAG TPA: VIT domain-containing protein, partial [Planctomycetota bacterium]|nr:VIT domain-containing protein [Planctomycetota bacterium]
MKRLVLPLSLLAIVLTGCFFLRPSRAVNNSPSPVSLTNPDGQALVLEKYDLRVAVHGPLSLTEMEMVFRNPENRVMEGRFLYLLPLGATISRFAKEVDGKLMEGEVVEKMRAQAIYTQILHEMRDPALLELDQGNRFSARVFPIPANGTVRLLLSYSQLLPLNNGERRLVIPMLGMPSIGEFTFSATIKKLPSETVTFTSAAGDNNEPADDNTRMSIPTLKNFTPQRDMELAFRKKPDAPRVSALKAGDYQMLCFQTEPPPKAVREIKPDWVLYFDTSASNADTEAQRLALLEALLPSNGAGLQRANVDAAVEVYAFDLEVAKLYEGRINAFGGTDEKRKPLSIRRMLETRHNIGATNLEATLKHMGERARALKDPRTFVLVSDGIATYGPREIKDLLAALGEWPSQHTLHALVVGSKQDQKVLNAIVEKGLGRVVSLPFTDNNEKSVEKAIAGLTQPLGETLGFYDEGATWMHPKSFRDVQPGQEVIVFSQFKAGGKSEPGMFYIDASTQKRRNAEELKIAPNEMPDFAPLLQREACAAKLAYLEQLEQAETNAARAAELKKERLGLSIKSRVLCPLTSLLVLETEADYQRFGIERTALADVMVIGKSGIELQKRAEGDLPALAVKTPKPGENRKGESPEKMKKALAGKAGDEEGKQADKLAEFAEKDGKADD